MFITFEGPDGAGKSTQLWMLAEFLTEQGHQVHTTREPGGTSIGDQIRQILHDVNNVEMAARSEILLYSASRAQNVAEQIRPGLAAGKIVLCDRFADSTLAYQGYGRGLDLNTLRQITHFATEGLTPDLTFFLDLPVEVGLRRKERASQHGGGEWNRMDQLTLAFHHRVRAGYQSLIDAEPERWVVVDADQPTNEVQRAIRAALAARMPLQLSKGTD